MKYLVSEVESWGKEIDAMPAPDPGRRRVGKKEAVILLAKKLRAAARRGFSTAELLDVLAAKGLKVHADTLRAALKVGGRGAVRCPVRSRRLDGGPKGLREGNGPASDTASGRPNAGGSVGDRPDQRADVGPELGLVLGRSAFGESVEAESESNTASGRSNAGGSDGNGPDQRADVGPELELTLGRGGAGAVAAAEVEVERDTTAARWGSGGSEGDDAKHGADVGPHAGPAEGREHVGEMPAILVGRVRRELGSDNAVVAESGGVELATRVPQEVGTAPGGAGADSGRRARPSSVDVPDKQVAEGGGRSASAPTVIARGGREASGSKGPERRPMALAPVRGSFTPREDSDEI
jgi:hypothetical protein